MLLSTVVIGSTVESLVYSFINGHYFLSVRRRPCLFYDNLKFRILGCKSELQAWKKICLMQGLLGKLLTYEEIDSVRIRENTMRINSKEGNYAYEFNECHIFDSSIVKTENNIASYRDSTFLVLDDFELSQLGPKIKCLRPRHKEHGFAKRINFYTSSRVDGADYITDCIVESNITKKQLYDFEYSDTMARFEVEHYLNSNDVFGILMGKYKNGTPKYRKPKVVHVKRLVFEIDNNIYYDSKNVKFMNKTMPEIIYENTT